MSKLFRKLLAINRIERLYNTFLEQSRSKPEGSVGTVPVIIAIVIAVLPALAANIELPAKTVDLTTVFVGISTCLAIIYRVKHKIPFHSVKEWTRSFDLTHTAFGLGCIPAVYLAIFHPHALYELGQSTGMSSAGSAQGPSSLEIFMFLLKVSVWAGFTEEFIYRGLLVGVMRRWRLIKNDMLRTLIAIIASALIFSLGHVAHWGILMSVALFGLGLGFGVAYIATGELLLPIIIYHICFDMLSLWVAIIAPA